MPVGTPWSTWYISVQEFSPQLMERTANTRNLQSETEAQRKDGVLVHHFVLFCVFPPKPAQRATAMYARVQTWPSTANRKLPFDHAGLDLLGSWLGRCARMLGCRNISNRYRRLCCLMFHLSGEDNMLGSPREKSEQKHVSAITSSRKKKKKHVRNATLMQYLHMHIPAQLVNHLHND